jgi:NADH-quinone oxidoreductase subunit I
MNAARKHMPFTRRAVRHVRRIGQGAASLAQGMRVTLYYLFHPKEIVTEEYPENRATLKMAEAFRGVVVMPHDEQGEHKCTACTICEKACPNGSISILVTKNEASQRVLGKFVYRLSQCTLCALCVEACPFGAIEMDPSFETTTIDKGTLDVVLNKKEGRA